MTRDTIFAFIGGTIVGASGAVAVMKKIGYCKLSDAEADVLYKTASEDDGNAEKLKDSEVAPIRDKPSYEIREKVDTSKTAYYSIAEKPSLDEMMKQASLNPQEEDKLPEDDEAEDIPEPVDEDLDYGHIIQQLPARRKDDLIFLIHQDYAGECYLLEDLIYYQKDDVLADVTDVPVDDPLTVIGDSLGYFGKYADDGKLFVRNCTMGIEYEVTLVDGRYADKLYGVDTSEIEELIRPIKTKMRKERKE